MRDFSLNHYERAFENWLIDHHILYVHCEEQHRLGPSEGSVKNFDFLLRPASGRKIIVEVKGRTFSGATLAGLAGLECWVTRDDVKSLQTWQKALGSDHEAVFVFAYRIVLSDVDFDGHETLMLGRNRYVFFCLRLEDYARCMRSRSRRWRTVTLTAGDFRWHAKALGFFLSRTQGE
ncbi:MAG: HYExAFE family protein [Phycisphaerales bacterium]